VGIKCVGLSALVVLGPACCFDCISSSGVSLLLCVSCGVLFVVRLCIFAMCCSAILS